MASERGATLLGGWFPPVQCYQVVVAGYPPSPECTSEGFHRLHQGWTTIQTRGFPHLKSPLAAFICLGIRVEKPQRVTGFSGAILQMCPAGGSHRGTHCPPLSRDGLFSPCSRRSLSHQQAVQENRSHFNAEGLRKFAPHLSSVIRWCSISRVSPTWAAGLLGAFARLSNCDCKNSGHVSLGKPPCASHRGLTIHGGLLHAVLVDGSKPRRLCLQS